MMFLLVKIAPATRGYQRLHEAHWIAEATERFNYNRGVAHFSTPTTRIAGMLHSVSVWSSVAPTIARTANCVHHFAFRASIFSM